MTKRVGKKGKGGFRSKDRSEEKVRERHQVIQWSGRTFGH